MRERPIGSAERSVLLWLADNRGNWTENDGNVWESKFWTLQLLSSLATKGLVKEVVVDAHYELTAEGRELASMMPAPGRLPRQATRTYTGRSGNRPGSVTVYRPRY